MINAEIPHMSRLEFLKEAMDKNDKFSLLPYKELRVTEMAGFDYIFIPHWLFEKIQERNALQEFLLNALTMLGTQPERCVVIRYQHVSNEEMVMDKFNLEWIAEYLVSYCKEPLNESTQFEFIRTLFWHSEPLVD